MKKILYPITATALLLAGCSSNQVSSNDISSLEDYKLCEQFGYNTQIADSKNANLSFTEIKKRVNGNTFSLSEQECQNYMAMGANLAKKDESSPSTLETVIGTADAIGTIGMPDTVIVEEKSSFY